MLYETACSELIRCVKGLDRRLKDSECWHRGNQQMALKEKVEQRQKVVVVSLLVRMS